MLRSAVRRAIARPRMPHRRRSGVALVATLALLSLAVALLAGAFAAATASARATRSVRAGIVAHAAARRGIASAVVGWSAADDSLPVGASVTRAMSDSASVPRDAADTRLRVDRLSPSIYLVAAEAIVPAVGLSLARRRVRVLLERPRSPDSTVVLPPRPLARWAVADLY